MAHKRTRKEFEADLQSQQSPFVFYGTPLPPLDPDVRDDGSYVPIWKQEVVDDKGRKRLHGAFEGGFSAGYFNTVGSKEGWAPSTFVSSRSNRHKDEKKNSAQRVEDFMDDEDLANASEAQVLQTNQGFSGIGSTAEDAQRKGGLLDLFRNQEDSTGVKLLRKMGWRDGQGVGPQVRRKANLDDSKSVDQSSQEEHHFAPRDSPMVRFDRKNDSRGVGYDQENRLEDSSATRKQNEMHRIEELPKQRSPGAVLPSEPRPQRSGFGVGVLNDQGSDEDDEYAIGPRVAYNRTIGGDKKTSTKTKGGLSKVATKVANPLLKTKPVYQGKRGLKGKSGFRRCHDGKLPLEGFILASAAIESSSQHSYTEAPLPQVPDDWKSEKVPSTESNTTYQSTADVAKASTLDANARAAILGETQLPGKSIFDFMSSSARDRIASASGKTNLPLALNEKPPGGIKSNQSDQFTSEIPYLEKSVALAAMGRGAGGWMPYAEDQAKRQRYRDFIEHHAGIRPQPPQRPQDTANDIWLQELREFAHAAEVFKPVSGVMASRFTSASSAPKGGAKGDEEEGAIRLREKEPAKSSDPAEQAARMGQFGPLTRSITQFFPTRLLCKRFNVALPVHAQTSTEADSTDPNVSVAPTNLGSKQQASDLISEATMAQMRSHAQQAAGKSSQLKQQDHVLKSSFDDVVESASIEGPAEVDASRNDALEGRRAGEAVFKAVFGDDDSDSK